ncbi:MAG: hypothetical protein JO055_09135 [Alphaproteobacteria bacterium]|nr:hypothetical protein [Alphaproteobacteria bacterium]
MKPYLTRRHTIVGLGAALASPALAQANFQPRDLTFRVIRKGSPMGTFATRFTYQGDRLIARTSAALEVRVAGLRVFRYSHESTEVRRGDELLSLQADTYDDGPTYKVTATPGAGGLMLDGPDGKRTVPTRSLTSNCCWNPGFVRLQQPVIDAERARYETPRIDPLGQRTLTVMGAPRAATGHRMTVSYANGELWYDAAGEWVYAIFNVKGESLTYERIA